MTVESSTMESLFLQRTVLVNKMSQVNTVRLRLLQRYGGLEILGMNDPHDSELAQKLLETEDKIVSSQTQLDLLEIDLLQIDKCIDIAINEEA